MGLQPVRHLPTPKLGIDRIGIPKMPRIDKFSRWFHITLPFEYEENELLRTIALCQRVMTLRLRTTADGAVLEVMATSADQAAQDEVVFQQVLCDQLMRRQINAVSDKTIGAIADAVLLKAVG